METNQIPPFGILEDDFVKTNQFASSFDKKEIVPAFPHQFNTLVESLDDNFSNPEIVLTPESHKHIYTIIKNCGDDEIGWLGSVKQKDNKFTIDNIFLFEQKVGFAETEIDAQALGKFYSDYNKKFGPSLLNRILFWGHVHPGDTDPSPQDENQMELFAHNKYFIRGIFNRDGHACFDFFDYQSKIKIIDCPWSIECKIDTKFENDIKEEIAKKVKKKRVYTPKISKFSAFSKTSLFPWKNLP